MKREAVIEEFPHRRSDHPFARKPLSAFQSITAICNDCGHSTLLNREALDGLSTVATFADLWRHAFCNPCRQFGRKTKNVSLQGQLTDTPIEDREPLFDEAPTKRLEVFGEDRSDPYAHLPKSRLMRCA